MSQLSFADDAVEGLLKVAELQRDAWKEAFLASVAYYSNNNGINASRLRQAKKRLKELKLIK